MQTEEKMFSSAPMSRNRTLADRFQHSFGIDYLAGYSMLRCVYSLRGM
jgi:hypothetical protein